MNHRIGFCVIHATLLASVMSAWGQNNQAVQTVLTIDSPTDSYRQFEETEITGSAIFRKEEKSSLPLEVLTREDIRKSGATSLSQVLQNLTVMQNNLGPGQMLSPTGGYSTVAIHGMQKGTLILVNGLRIAPYGRQTNSTQERSGIDLNNLPLASIDRIEILTDGASSLYGTDALAGVINIIMTESRSGVQLQVDAIHPNGGHGQQTQLSLTAGQGQLIRDGFTRRMSAEASRQDALRGSDRPYASAGESNFNWQGVNYRSQAYYLSGARSPGTLIQLGSVPSIYNPAWTSALQTTGTCPTPEVLDPLGGYCYHNPYPQLDLYPSMSRHAAHFRAEAYLDRTMIGHVEWLGGQNTQQLAGSPYGSGLWQIRPGSVGEPFVRQAGLSIPALLLWSPSELPGPVTQYRHATSRFSAGLRGEWNSWNYRANLYQSQSQSDWQIKRYLSDATLQGLPLTADMFTSLPGTELARQLENMMRLQPLDHGFYRIQGLDLRASRDAFELPGGPAQWGSGLELRREQVFFQNDMTDPSAVHRTGQTRHDVSAYGELRLPLAPVFEITASVRADRYDQFKTFNGKLSALWRPASHWRIRASAGTGFQAPGMGQLNADRVEVATVQAASYAICTAAILATTGAMCPGNTNSIRVISSGSDQLLPEQSTQTTFGIHHDFNPRLSASVDYWQVAMRNQISSANPRDIMMDPANHMDNFSRDTQGYLALYTPLFNLGRSLKEGVDLDLRYWQVLDSARWTVQAQGTYYLRSWQQASMNEPVSSDLGRGSVASGLTTPRFKGRLLMGLTQQDWSGLLSLNYQHSYISQPFTAFNTARQQFEMLANYKIPAYWTVDVSAQLNLRPGLDLRWGIKNLLNRQAPTTVITDVPNLSSTNLAYADLWGCTLQLGITARF